MVIERKIWNISGVNVSNTNLVFKLGKEYFYSPEQSGPVSVGELPHEGASLEQRDTDEYFIGLRKALLFIS